MAKQRGESPDELDQKLRSIRSTLHEHREKRIRPQLDDKILTDWNGLMVAALARSAVLFKDSRLLEKAEKAWQVIQNKCITPDGKLLHRLKDGDAAIAGMADDYAFTIWGLTELYHATFKPEYLKQAVQLQQISDELLLDPEYGGYFFTAKDAEMLLGRQKEIYDGAIPSANSVAALNGFRLSRLTGKTDWEQQSLDIFKAFSDQIINAPAGYTFALHAYQVMQSETMEIVICSPEWNSETEQMMQTCREYAPAGSAILLKTPEMAEALNDTAPFVKDYPVQDKTAVYICRNFHCEAPVFTNKEVLTLLQDK